MRSFWRFAAFATVLLLMQSAGWAAPEADVPVPVATAASLAQQTDGNIRWAAEQLLALAIPLFFLFTGLGARLRQKCDRITGGRRFLTVTLFAVFYLTLAALIAMPFDFYVHYVRPHADGSSDQPFLAWLNYEVVQMAIRLVAAALLIWLPYRLIAWSPRRWWLWGTLALLPFAFLALVGLPVWIDPLTNHYEALNDPAMEARIEALAARCGIPHIPVFVGGGSTQVTGLGPTNRIVLQSNLTEVETPDQIDFTIGHELKHYVMGDNWKALAIIGAFLLGGFWLTDRIGRAAIGRFSRLWGVKELADPASLPLVMFLLTFLWLAVLPGFNLFARHIEHEADRFGLELTHQNHATAAMFAEQPQSEVTPEWDSFFLIMRATHPSNAQRVEFANSYKPWEQGKKLAYDDVCRP